MDFTIKNIQIGVAELSRAIGYVIIDTRENGEYNLVRKLHFDNYPRFHVYLKSRLSSGRGSSAKPGQQGNNYIFSLHLDQKKPIYHGTHAHNGEYFGPVIEDEADRIKQILSTTTK